MLFNISKVVPNCKFQLSLLLVFSCLPLHVSAEITFGEFTTTYGECGSVKIDAGAWEDGVPITEIDWDWGDGIAYRTQFPAMHEYEANGDYDIVLTAYGHSGDTRSAQLGVLVSNANDPGCELDFSVHPWQVYLRDGATEKQLLIEIRNDEGLPINPETMDIDFEVVSDQIGDLQVSATGLVSATGYGRGVIRVVLQPSGRTVEVEVHAGHLRTAPMFQYLSVTGQSSGKVWADIANADGTPVDLQDRQVYFSCNACGPGQPLQIDTDGNLQVVEDYEPGDPAPLVVNAVVDGEWPEYSAVIHVGEVDLGLTLKNYVTHNTIISSATGAAGYNFDAAISDYLMPQLYDLGYEWQSYLMSGSWWDGPKQALINYTSLSRFNGTFPGCGGSGNPIRMGTNIEEPTLSCFFTDIGNKKMIPRWGIAYHELGHNMLETAGLFNKYGSAGDGVTYSEGLATAAGMFTCEAILRAGESVGVTAKIAESFEISLLCWRRGLAGTVLPEYIAAGADYSTISPDVIDDILFYLVQEFDYGLIYRLFGMFTPRDQGIYPFEINSAEQQATMFAVGCSVATGVDLKSRFRNEWGFPIDDATWDEMYPVIEKMIKARYPASNAGADRRVALGTPVQLKNAFVFDREQDELQYEWRVTSKPPGSIATISDPSRLHPVFTTDRVGEYVLSLRAWDQWAQGDPDSVTITVAEAAVIFSHGFE